MPETQSAAAVLMIRPRHFTANPETLASNRFQAALPSSDAGVAARAEFDALAEALASAGVAVHVLEGCAERALPDEIFPNNWVSFHADGTVVLYPMMAPSRRLERRRDAIDALTRLGYAVRDVVDLSPLERDGHYLEGTGSLVLDRERRVAYACLSPRTTRGGLEAFAKRFDYDVVELEAVDHGGHPIYHTNVMLSVGTRFAIVCSETVRDAGSRARLLERLADGGRDVIEISLKQMHAFAANLLELRGRRGAVIALSAAAAAALDDGQRRRLASQGELVPAQIGTIEAHGGGSVRCMLAEVHLPRRAQP
ncbi:MAG: amidinotransferase [Gammaproteobacteria bacterium]|nr:amidinotransferase [Gammaproteobacteria bacterium]